MHTVPQASANGTPDDDLDLYPLPGAPPDWRGNLALLRTLQGEPDQHERSSSFCTTEELAQRTPKAPRWIWDGYLARGWLSILAGKPKAGKSTLLGALIKAVATARIPLLAPRGTPPPTFLGREITPGHVVLVTEENNVGALAKLPVSHKVHVLTRDGQWPRPSWDEVIADGVAECCRTGARLLVIDSLAFWSQLPADAEKDAGAMQKALEPLLCAASRYRLAILLVHHQGHRPGQHVDALRGSSAIAGTADMIVSLEHTAEVSASHRQLLAVGRWPQTPGLLLLDREREGDWDVLGQGDGRDDVHRLTWRERLLQTLPDSQPGMTYAELEEALGAKRKDWYDALQEVWREGHLDRSGAGKKGDPLRFSRSRNSSRRGPCGFWGRWGGFPGGEPPPPETPHTEIPFEQLPYDFNGDGGSDDRPGH